MPSSEYPYVAVGDQITLWRQGAAFRQTQQGLAVPVNGLPPGLQLGNRPN